MTNEELMKHLRETNYEASEDIRRELKLYSLGTVVRFSGNLDENSCATVPVEIRMENNPDVLVIRKA